jgi:hypothetical protein
MMLSATLSEEGLFFVGVASSHDKVAARCRSHKKKNNLPERFDFHARPKETSVNSSLLT